MSRFVPYSGTSGLILRVENFEVFTDFVCCILKILITKFFALKIILYAKKNSPKSDSPLSQFISSLIDYSFKF